MTMTDQIQFLETAATILADEQLEFPDMPARDMSKYVHKSRYDDLLDPAFQGPERDEMETAYEDHIDRMTGFIEDIINELEARNYWYESTVDNIWYFIDTDSVVDRVERAAPRDNNVIERLHAAIAANDISQDILRDALAGCVTVTPERDGLQVGYYEDEHDNEETDEDLLGGSSQEEKFDALVEGLDFDDLGLVEENIRKNTNSTVDFHPHRLHREKVAFTVYYTTRSEYYFCVEADEVLRAVEGLLEDSGYTGEEGQETSPEFAVDPAKQLPEGLTGNQLALLRIMDVKGVDSMNSSDLKGLPIANVPWVSKLLKSNKVLTRDIIKQAPHEPLKSTALQALPKFQRIQFSKFPLNLQILWKDRQNWEFIIGLPQENFAEVFGFEMPRDVAEYMRTCRAQHSHPAINKNVLTIGWFRFTVFDRDIWIDEVQTDLEDSKDQKVGDESVKLFDAAFKNELGHYLFETFIREMRSRGYERFFMPNYETKKASYVGVSPPAYLYNDVPKAMRFRTVDFKDLDRPEFALPEPPKLEGVFTRRETAEVSSNQYLFEFAGKHPVRVISYDDEPERIRVISNEAPHNGSWAVPWVKISPDDVPPKFLQAAEAKATEGKLRGITPTSKVLVLSSTRADILVAMASRIGALLG